MVKAKNNEVSAFIEMIDNGSLPQDSIFYADAINTTAKMIEFLNSRHLDYIMAVKTNLSNRPVVMAMEKYISGLTDKTQNTSSHYHEVGQIRMAHVLKREPTISFLLNLF